MNLFIGGSRRISRLGAGIQEYLDKYLNEQWHIIVGDANGVDKAVQTFLKSREYENVEVFCADGNCRNNLGNWKIRSVSVPKGRKGFDYYTTKDREMAEEATRGFMIWDGESRGTLTQLYRLLSQEKPADMFISPSKEMVSLANYEDWEKLVLNVSKELREKSEGYVTREKSNSLDAEQGRLI
jgi:hypothetical protein